MLFINRNVKQLKLKAMKKVIVLSLMSLLFLATFAQRPSKSRSNEVNDNDRNKSEMTTNRSNGNNNRTYTPGNSNPGNDMRNESNNHITRSVDDKIVNNKTEVHKNINTGRDRGINSRTYEVERKNYNSPYRNRAHHEYYSVERPRPLEYRRIHQPYRAPFDIHVYWTPRMYHEYMMIYPDYGYWYYPNGYMIRTISAYDAMFYIGEVVNVYGRVYETWYSRETDEYILYFGSRYPYQDFSVVIPGHKARQFSHRPEIFFEGRYIWVTGLISLHQGQPEMIVMRKHQIHLY